MTESTSPKLATDNTKAALAQVRQWLRDKARPFDEHHPEITERLALDGGVNIMHNRDDAVRLLDIFFLTVAEAFAEQPDGGASAAEYALMRGMDAGERMLIELVALATTLAVNQQKGSET